MTAYSVGSGSGAPGNISDQHDLPKAESRQIPIEMAMCQTPVKNTQKNDGFSFGWLMVNWSVLAKI
ncbi:MAG: hypothetical protein IKP87_14030 [Victivallales bacterium]|nr:hypothetical protein [Victivallales bacterium]